MASVAQKKRPEFIIRQGMPHKAAAFGVEELAKDGRTFERGMQLVSVARWTKKDGDIIDRPEGAAVIAPIVRRALWLRMSELVRWVVIRGKDGEERKEPVNLDMGVVDAVLAGPEWPHIPYLKGITSIPMVGIDGSISTVPGYDARTGFYYAPEGAAPDLLKDPSRDDAAVALDELLDVVRDFPFKTHADIAGWVAALLTPLVRHLCDHAPAVLIDANTPGSGKTKLGEIIGQIVLGHPIPASAYASNDDEVRKRVLAHALTGDTLVMIDNCPPASSVGWPNWDRFLTSETVDDRILGESRIVKVPNQLCWMLTGNNLSVRGDAVRRSYRIRLESPLERPEDRPSSDFAHPDLLQWVQEERPRLLGAALTILSAYLRSGERPDLPAWGSFESWSMIVRGCLVWLGQPDPGELRCSRADDGAVDPLAGAHAHLLAFLKSAGRGMKAAELANAAEVDEGLRDALMEISGSGNALTGRSVGGAMRTVVDRVRALADGSQGKVEFVIDKTKRAGNRYIYKETAPAPSSEAPSGVTWHKVDPELGPCGEYVGSISGCPYLYRTTAGHMTTRGGYDLSTSCCDTASVVDDLNQRGWITRGES